MQKRREREREREREEEFLRRGIGDQKKSGDPTQERFRVYQWVQSLFFFNGSVGDLKKLELERKALNYFRAKKKKKNPLSLPAQTTTEILYKTPCQKRVVSLSKKKKKSNTPRGRRPEEREQADAHIHHHAFVFLISFFGGTHKHL